MAYGGLNRSHLNKALRRFKGLVVAGPSSGRSSRFHPLPKYLAAVSVRAFQSLAIQTKYCLANYHNKQLIDNDILRRPLWRRQFCLELFVHASFLQGQRLR